MTAAHDRRGSSDALPGLVGRLGRRISVVADAVCGMLFAAVFVIFCYKIARRYLPPHDAVAWADEVSVILFIWIVFLANGFVVEERRQISFDLLHRNLSPRGQRRMEIARMLLVGGIFLAAVVGSFDYILFLWREKTPVLQARLDVIYICFGFYMVAVIVRYAVGIAQRALQRQG